MPSDDTIVRDPELVARVAPVVRRALGRYFRARTEGLDALPTTAFLGVGTHNGGVLMPDMFLWVASYACARPEGPPMVILAHDWLARSFTWPTLAKLGAIRAEPDAALAALQRGFAVQTYPGGSVDAEKPFARRHQVEFAGRLGWARLAVAANVPVVPIVSVGAHETYVVLSDGRRIAERLGLRRRLRMPVWPIALSIPWGLTIGVLPIYLPLPTQITLRVLDAIDPRSGEHDDEEACVRALDRRVRTRMQAALDELARGRIPVLGGRR